MDGQLCRPMAARFHIWNRVGEKPSVLLRMRLALAICTLYLSHRSTD